MRNGAGASWGFGAGLMLVLTAAGTPRLGHTAQVHWAFSRPAVIVPPAVPAGATADWRRNPIDAFVYRAMAARGLRPSPSADRATLLRRVTFDLTGLPPDPREVDAFVNDSTPDAY